VKAGQLLDGTSKTMAFAEIMQGPQASTGSTIDRRGRIWNPASGTYQVSTFFTPNPTDGDSSRCQNRPEIKMPCVNRDFPMHALHTLSARSNHPGGANVSMFDGSVRFVPDSVDVIAWRAVGTRRDGVTVALEY
jgi:prepilin-type processing-associated H-X9-DG protein